MTDGGTREKHRKSKIKQSTWPVLSIPGFLSSVKSWREFAVRIIAGRSVIQPSVGSGWEGAGACSGLTAAPSSPGQSQQSPPHLRPCLLIHPLLPKAPRSREAGSEDQVGGWPGGSSQFHSPHPPSSGRTQLEPIM